MKLDKELVRLWLKGSGVFWIGYAIIYLCKSFVIFEFTNPFQWILDVPSYDGIQRFNILGMYMLWMFFKCLFIFLAKTNKN